MPLAGAERPLAERHRLVLGVFPSSAEAGGAITMLASRGSHDCDVLLVSDGGGTSAAAVQITFGKRVTIHHIDRSASDTRALLAALGGSLSRSGLRGDAGPEPPLGADPDPPGVQRLLQRLLDHLARGAAVVIVQALDPQQQLIASRALLDAKCKELLTHEVVQSVGCAPADRERDASCCGSCASKACGRFDPS
jgi:hypothetical protein